MGYFSTAAETASANVSSDWFTAIENGWDTTFSLFSPLAFFFAAASFLKNVPASQPSPFFPEFFGTLLMIVLTFAPGNWFFTDDSQWLGNWVSHCAMVIASDYYCGGQHVNPGASFSMYLLGKTSFNNFFIRVSAQMLGGMVAFPLFSRFSSVVGLGQFGGPAFDKTGVSIEKCFFDEMLAMIILLLAIFALNWELNFGKYHYWIKQTLTGIMIRFCIVAFGAAGPAINPMLGSTWDLYDKGEPGEWSKDPSHWLVYWVASFAGAFLASLAYALYSPSAKFLGRQLKRKTKSSTPNKKKRA